jgi:hypothetical protein
MPSAPRCRQGSGAGLLEGWVEELGLDPEDFGTHSMRTKATLIYRRTKNLRAVELLLGHLCAPRSRTVLVLWAAPLHHLARPFGDAALSDHLNRPKIADWDAFGASRAKMGKSQFGRLLPLVQFQDQQVVRAGGYAPTAPCAPAGGDDWPHNWSHLGLAVHVNSLGRIDECALDVDRQVINRWAPPTRPPVWRDNAARNCRSSRPN